MASILQWYYTLKANKWMGYFTVFTRFALALGFIPSGIVKITGERFTALSNQHPMGAYLQALYETGFYYPFIGYAQVLAAVLLLIPATATLGALLYLPIITNIAVLSFSVRFDGSLLTSPLMVVANIYLLCWDAHKLAPIFKKTTPIPPQQIQHTLPWKFMALVALVVIAVAATIVSLPWLKPYNHIGDCQQGNSIANPYPQAKAAFCNCIHTDGKPLDSCLKVYETTKLQYAK
ncbi:MAG: DoxX family protein [Bacteroidetes bacterium]|nr:MAG: DoxX family protein [Bacteroidota bacterium]TAE70735.1 MAG: DoxX family protein [Bacteroidota bacterium]